MSTACNVPVAAGGQVNNIDLYESPLYWNGPRGYRPPGYADFALNGVRAAHLATLLPPGAGILDVGAAMGYLVRRLRWHGFDAWGLEVSKYALTRAPREIRPFLQEGTATLLPYDDASFQFIVSCGVFEHLSEMEACLALSEFQRVAPRGLISLAVEGATHQHDDEGHDLLRPLAWWKARMPTGFDVMDDDTSAWMRLVPPAARYALQILLKTSLPDHPALTALLKVFSERGYVAWAAPHELAWLALKDGQEGYVVPGLVVPFATELDLNLLADRIATVGAETIVDEIIRKDTARAP